MDSMYCWDCLLKHIAAAVSYGKEIMSGHGQGAELDHRVDFLGEVVNAEHHAETIDKNLFKTISDFRKVLQNTHVDVSVQTIDKLRGLYIQVEALESEGGIKSSSVGNSQIKITHAPQPIVYSDPLDVVYEAVTDLEYFRYSYESIKAHLSNYSKIYVLHTELDLSEFTDVIIADKPLLGMCKYTSLSNDFLYMKENQAWINDEDAKRSLPLFSILNNENNKQAREALMRTGTSGGTKVYDNLKPQPVNKKLYAERMDGIVETPYPMTHYFSMVEPDVRNTADYGKLAVIERPVCCSTRGKLQNGTWATWNSKENFESMRNFLASIHPVNATMPPQPTKAIPVSTQPKTIRPNRLSYVTPSADILAEIRARQAKMLPPPPESSSDSVIESDSAESPKD